MASRLQDPDRRQRRRHLRQGQGQDAAASSRSTPRRSGSTSRGSNIVKRHQRPRPGSTDPGGVIEKPGPIHISNVMLLDPQENKPTRVGVVREDGKRYRVSKLTGEKID